MDPVLLELMRFGTAILAGGLVAVIAQRLAFDHARRLQRAETDQRDERARRTLFGELRDNMKLLYRPDPSHLGLLKSSAWDAARGLDWPEDLVRLLRDAYLGAEHFNRQVAVIEAHEGTNLHGEVANDRKAAVELADNVYVRFDRVRVALAAHVGIVEPKTWEA